MKRILVIGATSAIAEACIKEWAKQPCEFYLVARNQEKVEQIAKDLTVKGSTVTTALTDLNDLTQHAALVEQCIEQLHQIDVVLIAHGTLPDQALCSTNHAIAMQEFSNNGTSVISLLTLLAQQFKQQRCGTIAVISSVAGDRGRPSNYLYGTAKAAVSTFCEGLRADLFKQGVNVLTIKPGFVNTPMTQGLDLPQALVAQPEQVAKLIVRAIEKKRSVIYTPRFWALIMLIIQHIPRFIFKRLSL